MCCSQGASSSVTCCSQGASSSDAHKEPHKETARACEAASQGDRTCARSLPSLLKSPVGFRVSGLEFRVLRVWLGRIRLGFRLLGH